MAPLVVLLVLDGLPARHVGPACTPVLASLGASDSGGWCRDGGVAVMSAATYPNHATFVTGAAPAAHGIFVNDVLAPDGSVVPAADVGPAVPTLFDAARLAGLSTAAVYGDQYLVGATGARASVHWPLDGRPGDEVPRDRFGYPADEATAAVLADVVGPGGSGPSDPSGRPDLVVAQLNGPDTAGHLFGPDSEEAHDDYRRTDAALGVVVEALRPHWSDVVLMVVSDHDQEEVADAPGVDLVGAASAAGLDVTVVPDGGAALVSGPDPSGGAWLAGLDGVAGSAPVGPSLRLVWAAPGRWVGRAGAGGLRGVHGAPSTDAQVAVVAGGHPAVPSLAASLARRRPAAADWAPTVAALLGFALPDATGVALV